MKEAWMKEEGREEWGRRGRRAQGCAEKGERRRGGNYKCTGALVYLADVPLHPRLARLSGAEAEIDEDVSVPRRRRRVVVPPIPVLDPRNRHFLVLHDGFQAAGERSHRLVDDALPTNRRKRKRGKMQRWD